MTDEERRDEFARSAAQAVIEASQHDPERTEEPCRWAKAVAKEAYRIADAMLEQRDRR